MALGVFDAMPANVAVIDQHGLIVATNRAWRQFAVDNGLSAESAHMIGVNYLDVCDATSGPERSDAIELAARIRALLSGAADDAEMCYPCHSPTVRRWYQVRASAFEVDGRRYAVISHDNISRPQASLRALRQRADEVAGVARALSVARVATELSHELNQPLAAIVNWSRGIQRRLQSGGIDPATLRQVIDQIASQAERCGELVRRARHDGRAVLTGKSGSQTAADGRSDVADVLKSAAALLEDRCQAADISLALDIEPNLPPARIEPVALQQVAVNLLSNACDALARHDGRRRVTVTARARNGRIELRFADTGPGISGRRQRQVIFDPLVSTRPDGLGLGLAITRSIIDSAGGHIFARTATCRRRCATGESGLTMVIRLRQAASGAAS